MSNATYQDNIDAFDSQNEDSTKDLYLTFEIDGEDFGIDVINVKEIITMTAITIVPHAPHYVKGIVNLRGDIIPVINVRLRFQKPEIPYSESSCIVVIEYEEYILGLIVDRVKGVVTIPEESISPPPNAKLSFSNLFVRNLGKYDGEVKLLLNLDKLIFE